LINVADELHHNLKTLLRFQRQIFVADIFLLLQLFQHRLVGLEDLERAEFGDGFADQFMVRKTQQFNQERICIGDASRFSVQNQDPVLRRFE